MSRKKHRKSKTGESTSAPNLRREEVKEIPPMTESDGKMDFGGLPERDLKKNLGCG